jgi:hypothetical protein
VILFKIEIKPVLPYLSSCTDTHDKISHGIMEKQKEEMKNTGMKTNLGEVRTAQERFQLGSKETRHWPKLNKKEEGGREGEREGRREGGKEGERKQTNKWKDYSMREGRGTEEGPTSHRCLRLSPERKPYKLYQRLGVLRDQL